MTTKFLICDAVKNEKVWVAATTVREALIKRENELRAAATIKTDWRRTGKPALPALTKVSHYSQGDMLDVSVADVSCIGQKQHVIREIAQ
jgi:hypothetical protein